MRNKLIERFGEAVERYVDNKEEVKDEYQYSHIHYLYTLIDKLKNAFQPRKSSEGYVSLPSIKQDKKRVATEKSVSYKDLN